MTRTEAAELLSEGTRAARIKAARVFYEFGMAALRDNDLEGWKDIEQSIQLWIDLGKVAKANDIYHEARSISRETGVSQRCEMLVESNTWYAEMRD